MLTPQELRPICQTGKNTDPAWYRVHRRLSIYLTWALLHTRITLDQVSLLMIACGVAGAALQLSGVLAVNATGWALLYVAFLLDKVDGEMARYRRQESVTGILLDRFHHRLAEPLLFLAVGVHEYRLNGSVVALVAAFATMLAANAIEETQQLPAFIAHKFARETKRWPASGRRPSAGLERLASVLKSLKVFRTFITVLPMVVLTYLLQTATGTPAPTLYLVTAAVSLWVYVLFQARYYYAGRLEADVHTLGRQLNGVLLPSEAATPAVAAAPSPKPMREPRAQVAMPVTGLLLALTLSSAATARAATYYVDAASTNCSSAGPGTEALPYCTISSALSARAAAGNTIVVKPGIYREQVTLPASGTAAAPFVLQASGPGVVIDGADDYAVTSKWVLSSGSIYKASSVVWSPKQVYVNGLRYAVSTASTSAIPAGSYRWVAGSGLFINVGGGNPGLRQVLVGRRTYGIVMAGRSWVKVDGFSVTRTEDRGIYANSGSNDITISHNTVTLANKYGIQVSESARALIQSNLSTDNANHGIAVTTSVSDCVIEDNESARNAVPGTRSANGLYLYGASACRVQRNRWHDNQDTGEHIQQGANNISVGNLSWNNGDHGFDHLFATGTQHVGDVAYGNFKDGFSIEGGSPGSLVANCIAVNNGLTTSEFNLWVDPASAVSFVSNDNLFWNSTSQQPIKYMSTVYSTIAAFSSASGMDTRSIQADPRFVAPTSGNFHLQQNSPAIDNANSSVPNWPATDGEGLTRRDDPSTPNTGQGSLAYADRGALEFQPAGLPPLAALIGMPAIGTAPAVITLDGSGSTDPDGGIVGYTFNFGDGASSGMQPGPTTTHTYAAGTWTATLTVIDDTGMTATASTIVISNQAPVAVLGVTPTSGRAPVTVTANATASTDADGSVASYQFDFGDGTVVGPQASASATHTFGTGNWLVRATVADNRGASSAPSTAVLVSVGSPNQPPTAALTLTPSLGPSPLAVTANASGSADADGTIASYRFDFGDGTIVGPQPGPTATHTLAGGTWTVTAVVTDNDGGTATTSASVTATTPNLAPHGSILSPGDITVEAGQSVVFTSTAIDPDGNLPITYAWDFGGGAINSTLQNPSAVVFHNVGTYTITLTVSDSLGLADPSPESRLVTVIPLDTGTPEDQVHWTIMGQGAVTFDWRGPSSSLHYGLTSAHGQTVSGMTPTPLPYSSPGPFWEARITGLTENTVYHYSVGNGNDYTFRTPPSRGSAGFTIMAQGDIGDATLYPGVAGVQGLIAAQNPAFTLCVGDLTYGNENGLGAVDRHFEDVTVWSQSAAYMPAWGNHEWESVTDDLRNYKGRFELPNPRVSPGISGVNGGGEDWYWFDYGNTRFINYPEPYPGAWEDWRPRAAALMDSAQADAAIQFIVTFGHRPAYSSGHHAGEPRIRGYLDSLGLTHPKYVLNVNGHSHNYERTYPQNGVIHVTVGTGGSSLEEDSTGTCAWAGGCPPPAWSAFRAYHRGALRLRFTAGGIEGEQLCGPAGTSSTNLDDMSCAPGTVIDAFVIGTPTLDRAPVVSAPDLVTIAEGSTLTLVVPMSDPDGDPILSLAADLSRLPVGHGAVFTPGPDNLTGVLNWTPTFADSGSYLVSFSASNSVAGSASTLVRVLNTDRAPLVGGPTSPILAREDSVLMLAVTATDPDGDAITGLSASFSPVPPGGAPAMVPGPGNTSGTLLWTPTFADSGSYAVTISASNAVTGSTTLTLIVRNLDRAPVVTAPSAFPGEIENAVTFNVTATDIDGDAIQSLTADLSALPAGNTALFVPAPDQGSGTLTWTPAAGDTGFFQIVFRADNALTATSATAINIGRHDRAPALSHPDLVSVLEGSSLSISILATDPDSNSIGSLTAVLGTLPAGNNAVFTPAPGNRSGTFTWTPGFADSGTYAVQWIAANALADTGETVIQVGNVDRTPVVTTIASLARPAGTLIDVAVTAADPDGDAIATLSANLSTLPLGHTASFTAAVDRRSGTLLWTPAAGDTGTYVLVFTGGNALTGTSSTTLVVTAVNLPPIAVLQVSPNSGNAPLAVTANASSSSDPEGALLSFRFDFGDGAIVGPQSSPVATHSYAAGQWTLRLHVTDAFGAVSTSTVPVTVAVVEPGVNLVTNPSFELNTSGWSAYSSAALLRVANGFDGGFALQMTGPATTGAFGVNDSPNWVTTTAGVGTRYRLSAWVRSATAFGSAKLQVREYVGGTRIGATLVSPVVTLSPAWQLITVDHVVQAVNSTIDLQVFEQPLVVGEVFQTDNISIRVVPSPGGPAVTTAMPDENVMNTPGGSLLEARHQFRAHITPSVAHPDATLLFETTQNGPVRVELFDAAGRRLRVLHDEPAMAAGVHQLALDGRAADGSTLVTGLYFYRVQAAERTVVGRYVIIR
jgi:PKD repeat protein/phosphatidylglycerophosphate synthase